MPLTVRGKALRAAAGKDILFYFPREKGREAVDSLFMVSGSFFAEIKRQGDTKRKYSC